jgi:glycosyltransferase involved in cell wall biosynthesis
MGIPTVSSNVQHFKETIVDGHTGFLCDTDEEWEEALSILIENEERRREMGRNAYNEVKRNFNIEVISRRYAEILKEIHNDPKRFKKPLPSLDAGGHNKRHQRRRPHLAVK